MDTRQLAEDYVVAYEAVWQEEFADRTQPGDATLYWEARTAAIEHAPKTITRQQRRAAAAALGLSSAGLCGFRSYEDHIEADFNHPKTGKVVTIRAEVA